MEINFRVLKIGNTVEKLINMPHRKIMQKDSEVNMVSRRIEKIKALLVGTKKLYYQNTKVKKVISATVQTLPIGAA